MTYKNSDYWNEIGDVWQSSQKPGLWRMHSDAVNTELCERWLPEPRNGRLFKTDLFDEATGEGLYPFLNACGYTVTGIDISSAFVRAVKSRYPALKTACMDVRRLAFGDASFDVIVSNSTLDHFETEEEILRSMKEFFRVLKDDGVLILTMDNLSNPLVALRNGLPFRMLHRLGIVPYYVGAACGPRRLRHLLCRAAFEPVQASAILHCPRVFAVATAGLLDRFGPAVQRLYLWVLKMFEFGNYLPFRYLTGYYVAVQAKKSNNSLTFGI